MTRILLAATGLLLLPGNSALPGEAPAAANSKRYEIPSVERDSITVDGVLGDSEWPATGWETGFSFPWRKRQAPATEMCCVCDGKRLLFAFRCDDADIVVCGTMPEDEMAVARGDRIELFFARDTTLDEYYCLEISPAGAVLDYRASYYRKFDREWDCPDLIVAAGTQRGGYIVEGSIPLAVLGGLCGSDLGRGETLLAGAFRAEYSHTGTAAPEEAWISWVRPQAQKPGFHIPSALGRFCLHE